MGKILNLKNLDLDSSGIQSLPSSIGKLINLKKLDLGHTEKLSDLPSEIGNLASLKTLYTCPHSLSYGIKNNLCHAVAYKNVRNAIESGKIDWYSSETSFTRVFRNSCEHITLHEGDDRRYVFPGRKYSSDNEDKFTFELGDQPSVHIFDITKSDVIYRLLTHYEESFIRLIKRSNAMNHE